MCECCVLTERGKMFECCVFTERDQMFECCVFFAERAQTREYLKCIWLHDHSKNKNKTYLKQNDRSKTRSKHKKVKKERLFILVRTHNMRILGEIPFLKPQNDT